MKENKKQLELEILTTEMRKEILNMIVFAKGTHIGSAFSIIDLIVYLYDQVLKFDPKNPKDPKRDKFVLSKGHGCAALYVVLSNYNFFPKNVLKTYCMPGGILGGHPDSTRVPGVETSTGSLGHGLSVGVGFALANKINKSNSRVFCLVGDGECDEGAIWEAVMTAAHHKLNNLTLIIDNNKLMIGGYTKDILDPLSFKKKLKAFGWNTLEIDGHNFSDMKKAFGKISGNNHGPTAIIADTIKGKGVSFMEDQKEWHSMLPDEKQMKQALFELDESIDRINKQSNK